MSIKCKEGATVVGTFSSAALFDASCFARKWGLDYPLLGLYSHLLVLNISQKSELFIGYLDGDAERRRGEARRRRGQEAREARVPVCRTWFRIFAGHR